MMDWFGREDGHARIGLINVDVPPEQRRKGYARFLVSEIFRRARENLIASVAVATSTANQPALALYASLGFQPVDQTTLSALSKRRPPNQPSLNGTAQTLRSRLDCKLVLISSRILVSTNGINLVR